MLSRFPICPGPTDFLSALMMKPPIITQPSYHQQEQQQSSLQHQSSLQQHQPISPQKPPQESGVKRPFNAGGGGVDSRKSGAVSSPRATINAASDADMSPRKRLRKQQLMTKNDSSSAAGG